MGLRERLRHCSVNTKDEYLHELTGRSADAIDRLVKYARHNDGCMIYLNTKCVCGLSDLLKEIGDE